MAIAEAVMVVNKYCPADTLDGGKPSQKLFNDYTNNV